MQIPGRNSDEPYSDKLGHRRSSVANRCHHVRRKRPPTDKSSALSGK